jgi:exodeoxyribonuclease VII small subunit
VATKKKPRDFEAALERLEEITARLEQGQTPLEESIKLYTEGLEIARFCERKLAEAEKKIKIIRQQYSRFTEEDFDTDEVEP